MDGLDDGFVRVELDIDNRGVTQVMLNNWRGGNYGNAGCTRGNSPVSGTTQCVRGVVGRCNDHGTLWLDRSD